MVKKIKKILFAIPPSGLYRRDDRCQSKVEDQTVRIIFPPIDFALLAAIAVNKGIEAKIVDFPAQREKAADVKSILSQFAPDVILINTTAATLKKDLRFLGDVKSMLPEITTIAKGESLQFFAGAIFDNFASLDYIIYGECEEMFAQFLDGGEPGEINGLIFKDSAGRIVNTGIPKPPENLDLFPLPMRELLDNSLYISPETGNLLTTIHANRGCPAHCIFCPAGRISGYKIRYRSPEKIVDEIKECTQKFSIREFLFHGDTFTMNKKWILELCDRIIDARLDIRWGCNSRTDTFDDERAQKMKAAGCWVVAFGIETGSAMILEKIKKGAKLENALRAVEVCRRAGLRSHAFYVIGLPWETEETLRETYRFAKKLDTDFFDFNIAYPLPGTELYEIAKNENLIVKDENPLSAGGYGEAIVKTYTLSPEKLTSYRRKMLLSLYCRPAYIYRTLRNAGSAGVIFNYLKAAASRVLQLIK